jgi:hypothetical protein
MLRPVLVIAAILTSLAACAATSATSATSGGVSCPSGDRGAISSTRSGADSALVPAGAEQVLLCRYTGLREPGRPAAFSLVGHALVADAATVTSLASQLNALPPTSGTYSCPSDDAGAIVAYFRYGAGPDDPVKVGTAGCEAISNGHVSRLALGAPVVAEIERLVPAAPAPRPATIAGYIQLCGGPAPGRCFVSTIGTCGAHGGCSTTDRVVILDAAGHRVARARLHHARFHVSVPPGRYTVKLLADGGGVHGQVVQVRHVRAHAGRTATVRFFFAVP